MIKKYEMLEKVGSGNFSTVHLVKRVEGGQVSAMKVMRTHQNIGLKEAAFLKSFQHPNIIKLLDFEQDITRQETRMVLEYLPQNTLQLYEGQECGLRQEQVKCILFQASLGLAYIHERGIIHRDIKPQNILIDKRRAEIKLIDFGLAVSSDKISTDYVATRWYRAPQNLLVTKEYTCAIDVFSLACVVVELYLASPLFPGTDNLDQLHRIFNLLGQPNDQNWPAGALAFIKLGLRSHDKGSQDTMRIFGLRHLLKSCSEGLVSLLERMLILNPKKRVTSKEIVTDSYFHDIRTIIPPSIFRRFQKDHILKNSVSKDALQSAQNFITIARGKLGRLRPKIQVSPEPIVQQQREVSGLSFRGFQHGKIQKISVKEVRRIDHIPRDRPIQRDSRNHSIDSSQTSKTKVHLSNSIDMNKKILNGNFDLHLNEPRMIRHLTDSGRDLRDQSFFKNPKSKEKSQVLYFYGTQQQASKISARQHEQVIRPAQPHWMVADSSKMSAPEGIRIISQGDNRLMIPLRAGGRGPNQQISGRIQDSCLGDGGSFRQDSSWLSGRGQGRKAGISIKSKQRVSISPVGINLTHIQNQRKLEELAIHEPYSGNKAIQKLRQITNQGISANGLLTGMKVKNQRSVHQDGINRSIHENDVWDGKSSITSPRMELKRGSELEQRLSNLHKYNSTLNFYYPQPTNRLQLDLSNTIQDKKGSIHSPDSKTLKAFKSLQHRQTVDPPRFFINPIPTDLKKGPQVYQQRKNMDAKDKIGADKKQLDKRQYRQPRVTVKKMMGVQKGRERIGARQGDRNININLNLSFIEAESMRRGY